MMTLKDALGVTFIALGASVATLGYRILGLQWYFGAAVLFLAGLLLIWSAARDRKIQRALDEVDGDWGDRHYLSGTHATDALDSAADLDGD
ncbi:MAG: hypothetical protein ACJ8LG_06235 [Massilia sp.]